MRQTLALHISWEPRAIKVVEPKLKHELSFLDRAKDEEAPLSTLTMVPFIRDRAPWDLSPCLAPYVGRSLHVTLKNLEYLLNTLILEAYMPLF